MTTKASSTRKSMIELDTIYNEDCLEGMKRIPDGFETNKEYYDKACKRIREEQRQMKFDFEE